MRLRFVPAFLMLSLLLALSACRNYRAISEATRESTETSRRCTDLPSDVATRLEKSILAKGFQAELRFPVSVRSKDFSDLWAISGDLEGPGFEGEGQTATWATNKLAADSEFVGVDALAKAFSDFQGPQEPTSTVTMETEGIDISRKCVTLNIAAEEFKRRMEND